MEKKKIIFRAPIEIRQNIKTKDGIVERINKRYITEDGRQLLQD